jgi:hypothetical protein
MTADRIAQATSDEWGTGPATMSRVRWWVHNLVAHPLLVLCPPLGEWLHDRTAPDADRLMVDHGWHESGRMP